MVGGSPAPSLHEKHIDTLKRLASSGYARAREALAPGAVLLYVAAGGFAPHFLERALSTSTDASPGADSVGLRETMNAGEPAP